MIKEAYVSFEVAKLLKEKGFDYDGVCNHYYKASNNTLLLKPTDRNIDTTYYSAPTHQMALAWLREVYHIVIIVFPVKNGYTYGFYRNNSPIAQWNISILPTYEEGVEAAIKYSLENLI